MSAVVKKLPGYRLTLAGIFLACFVVILGAFTRLVDAGLGCPDWPGCYGHLLWPNDEQEIAAANSAFPDMPVIAGKPWPEMVHRYLAGMLALLIFVLAVFACLNRKNQAYPFRQIMFMSVLVIWQALFGMWTVTLKLWPQVVTIHLLGGFMTFTLMTVLAQRLSNYRWQLSERHYDALYKQRRAVTLGIIVVFAQVMLGGWLASNYAAFGCVDFPTCNGRWWPQMNMGSGFNIFQGIGPNYLGGLLDNEARVAIHFMHRLGALITFLYLFYLGVRLFAIKFAGSRKLMLAIWVVLFIQILLGITNVVLHIPLWISVAHNFVGAILVASLAALLTQIYRMRLIEQPK